MEIVLAEGIGSLQFGMTEAQLVAVLGQPAQVLEDEYGDRLVHYHDPALELRLEAMNQMRLGWITVTSPQATLFGQKLVNRPEQQVIPFLTQTIGRASDIETNDGMKSYFFESVGLELQFEQDTLKIITFSVPYDDEDQPMFPMDFERSDVDDTEYLPDPD